MASRTGVPGTKSTGNTLTAADYNNLPGGSIGYARITADSNTWSTTATAITGLSVTVTVGTSRRILIKAHGQIDVLDAAAACDIYLFEGATGFLRDRYGGGSGLAQDTMHLEHTLNPTAGAHTYFLKGDRVTGTSVQHIAASPDAGTGPGPAWIEVFDVGPAF